MISTRLLSLSTLSLFLWLPIARAQAPPSKETATVAAAIEALDCLAGIPEKCIPPAMLCDAQAVAIVPDILKAGFVLGGRHGHGVLLVANRVAAGATRSSSPSPAAASAGKSACSAPTSS